MQSVVEERSVSFRQMCHIRVDERDTPSQSQVIELLAVQRGGHTINARPLTAHESDEVTRSTSGPCMQSAKLLHAQRSAQRAFQVVMVAVAL